MRATARSAPPVPARVPRLGARSAGPARRTSAPAGHQRSRRRVAHGSAKVPQWIGIASARRDHRHRPGAALGVQVTRARLTGPTPRPGSAPRRPSLASSAIAGKRSVSPGNRSRSSPGQVAHRIGRRARAASGGAGGRQVSPRTRRPPSLNPSPGLSSLTSARAPARRSQGPADRGATTGTVRAIARSERGSA